MYRDFSQQVMRGKHGAYANVIRCLHRYLRKEQYPTGNTPYRDFSQRVMWVNTERTRVCCLHRYLKKEPIMIANFEAIRHVLIVCQCLSKSSQSRHRERHAMTHPSLHSIPPVMYAGRVVRNLYT